MQLYKYRYIIRMPVPVAAGSKAIVGSNSIWRMDVCLLCVSGRGLGDELITRPEESYRL
jgi:hypothetical protein